MNGIDLFNSVIRIDDDIVDRLKPSATASKEKHSRKIELRYCLPLAFAAAVVMVASLFAVLQFIGDNSRRGIIDVISNPSIRGRISFSGPTFYGDEQICGFSQVSGNLDLMTEGLSVTAKLVETLPDTYTFYDDWKQTEYRILHMTTVKLLKGVKMTKEFYYLMPANYMTDFSRYDRFVILDMNQFAYEYSVLYNKTQGKAEQLNIVLFGHRSTSRGLMGENFMAFNSNGTFDKSLWNSNNLWISQTKDAQPPRNISAAENKAKQDGFRKDLYVHLLKDLTGEAAEKLSEIQSLENGVFIPRSSSNILYSWQEVQLPTVRYIDGFATNERVSIYSREWTDEEEDFFTETKAHFTEDDLADLPDLKAAIETVVQEFDKGNIVPPHIENAGELELYKHGFFGWYAKTNDGVVGIVRVTWDFRFGAIDDAYFIVDQTANEIRQIDRDSLIEKFGEYETPYIYKGEYGKNGKIWPVVYF